MSAGCRIVLPSGAPELGDPAPRPVERAEVAHHPDRGGWSHVQDAEDVRRRLVDPLRPVRGHRRVDLLREDLLLHGPRQLGPEPVVGSEDVVPGGLVGQGRPGQKPASAVGRRQAHDSGLHVERRGGGGRPGVGARLAPSPADERRRDAVIGRFDAAAVLGRQEALVEVADDLLERGGGAGLVALPRLENGLRDIEEEAGLARPRRILGEDAGESPRPHAVERAQEGIADRGAVGLRELRAGLLQAGAQRGEEGRVGRAGLRRQGGRASLLDAGGESGERDRIRSRAGSDRHERRHTGGRGGPAAALGPRLLPRLVGGRRCAPVDDGKGGCGDGLREHACLLERGPERGCDSRARPVARDPAATASHPSGLRPEASATRSIRRTGKRLR